MEIELIYVLDDLDEMCYECVTLDTAIAYGCTGQVYLKNKIDHINEELLVIL